MRIDEKGGDRPINIINQENLIGRRIAQLGIFALFLIIYVVTCPPGLAPYRDAGEMVSVASTLGVAHPPGYPLYTVLARLAIWVPIGTISFRVTLLSAMAGACAVMLLFRLLIQWMPLFPAFIAAASFGFSRSFWDLATVPEMYTLGLLLLGACLNAIYVEQNVALFALLAGLSLGVRMDFLLLLPLLCWAVIKKFSFRNIGLLAVCFALGLSIFLFLPIRSLQDPWLDWGNPETLRALFNSVSRKSYSGTLDLLSLSYSRGENFLSTLNLYGKSAWLSFGVLMGFGLYGVKVLLKCHKQLGVIILGIFLLSGPLFFFLANMPPNPHAVAILEASYVVPDLMLAMLIGFGLSKFFALRNKKMFIGGERAPTIEMNPGLSPRGFFPFNPTPGKGPPIWGTLVFLLLCVQAVWGFHRVDKRNNWVLRDYVENLWRSVPEQGVLVMRKDVQLFSLWVEQLIHQRRTDVSVIAGGLSASQWYWQMLARWPVAQAPAVSLKDPSGWGTLVHDSNPRSVFAGYETEVIPSETVQLNPHGLVVHVSPRKATINHKALWALRALMLDRTRQPYGHTPDFFSTDLIGDTARAYQFMGHQLMSDFQYQEALWFFKRAQSLDFSAPQSYADEAYLWFSQKKYEQALWVAGRAIDAYEKSLRLARVYKSLPSVVNGFKLEYSNTLVLAGAAAEVIQGKPEARMFYSKANEIAANAQANYNMAVTYWNEDWALAHQYMKRAAQLNPQMPGIQNYVAVAEQRLQQAQQNGSHH